MTQPDPITAPAPTGNVRTLLRLEGLAMLLAASTAYFALGGNPWLFAALFFAPDLSFLAYTAGPRTGAIAYSVPEINCILEVSQVFLSAFLRPGADNAAKISSARETSNEGFRQQEDINAFGCCLTSDGLEFGQRLGCGSLSCRRRRS